MTKANVHMKTITNIIYLAFALFAFAFFALLPRAQAVTPLPDGGYPGQNTAEGTAALRDLTTGEGNTALGNFTLTLNTEGAENTAVGDSALRNSTTGSGNTAVGDGALINSNPSLPFGFNTAIGLGAGENVTTASGVTVIGANMKAENVSASTWIANIYGRTTQNGMTLPVIVSADGPAWHDGFL
jgi:hypothetical protein